MSLIYQSWVLMPFSLTMEMLHGLTWEMPIVIIVSLHDFENTEQLRSSNSAEYPL